MKFNFKSIKTITSEVPKKFEIMENVSIKIGTQKKLNWNAKNFRNLKQDNGYFRENNNFGRTLFLYHA